MNDKKSKIISIETSCDETAVSIMKFDKSENILNIKTLANIVRSQIDIHKEYGGVFPNLAKREHAKNLPIILKKCLEDASLFKPGNTEIKNTEQINELTKHVEGFTENTLDLLKNMEAPEIDRIVVTSGPGLEPALWVGINFAKVLSLVWNKPLIPANHMEGHILGSLINSEIGQTQSVDLSSLQFPALALLISGGHTELVLIKDWLQYEKIGQTVDDAIGEAFDKVARLLGLEYPGGPKVSMLAKEGKAREDIKLPRPMIDSGNYNFSFSGIKTAVLYLIKKLGELDDQTKKDIAKEFEEAVTEVLVKKTSRAIKEFGVKTLILGGGVSANDFIKKEISAATKNISESIKLLLPDKHISTDNSIMIGLVGIFKEIFEIENPKIENIKADSNWSL